MQTTLIHRTETTPLARVAWVKAHYVSLLYRYVHMTKKYKL